MNTAYVIFLNTLLDGEVPSVRGEDGKPVVFATETEAQREIADDMIDRLREFMDGERDFDDATTVEEYVLPVRVLPDGSVVDIVSNRCYS